MALSQGWDQEVNCVGWSTLWAQQHLMLQTAHLSAALGLSAGSPHGLSQKSMCKSPRGLTMLRPCLSSTMFPLLWMRRLSFILFHILLICRYFAALLARGRLASDLCVPTSKHFLSFVTNNRRDVVTIQGISAGYCNSGWMGWRVELTWRLHFALQIQLLQRFFLKCYSYKKMTQKNYFISSWFICKTLAFCFCSEGCI